MLRERLIRSTPCASQRILNAMLLALTTATYPVAGWAQTLPNSSPQPGFAPSMGQPAPSLTPAPTLAPAPATPRSTTPGRPANGVTTQTRPSSFIQPETAYTLGSGDRIKIDIFQVPQYSGEVDVLVDGKVNLPLVGPISVQGLTLEQAAAAIASAYGQYLRRPITTVSMVQRRQLKVGVAGEVEHPGAYLVSPDASGVPTLTQLLQQAGGTTQSANIQQIQIIRPQRSGVEQVLNVNLWQLLQTGDQRYDVTLRDGDSIFIPAKINDLAESSVLADASFAADPNKPINIAVIGEVFRPGPYTVNGSARTGEAGVPGESSSGSAPTVTRAIQVAGGIRPDADIRTIEVRRLTKTGAAQSFKVDLWSLLQEGDVRQDAFLQDGDTVVVPTAQGLDAEDAAKLAAASFSPDSIKVNVVGEVKSPGTLELRPNTPLNEAILSAGSFNTRANKRSVDLIRLNLDGTVSRRRIEIDFAQGINDQTNPALRNNDVVIVRRSGLASVGDALGTVLTPLNGVLSLTSFPLNFLNLFGIQP